MTLDEALAECVSGARITAAHLQPGAYVEHSFSRGFLRCWKVDKAEDEPERTQCDFRTCDLDSAADWRIIADGEQYPKPAPSSAWATLRAGGKLGVTIPAKPIAPPIADVIDLSAPPAPPVWEPKPLDPRKGGW